MRSIEDEIAEFGVLTDRMRMTFNSKRQSYGQTTTETWNKFGPISMLTRMHDKLGRLDNLLGFGNENLVDNETIEDTLLDLANYALITILEIQNQKMCLKETRIGDDVCCHKR